MSASKENALARVSLTPFKPHPQVSDLDGSGIARSPVAALIAFAERAVVLRRVLELRGE